MSDEPSRATVERALVLDMMGSFIRHQLVNHLAAVRNSSHFIRRRCEKSGVWVEDARLERFFDLIVAELEAATAFLGEGIRVPLAERAVQRGIDLRGPVEAALATVVPPPGITVELRDGDPVQVDGVEAELESAARQLLDNAIEACGEGLVEIRIDRQGDHARIVVADQGPGFAVPPDCDPAEPLVTTKQGHIGLGLAVARYVAMRHGGTLAWHDDEGTRVELRLPAVGS